MREQYTYSEEVFYNASGEEVARTRMYDDAWHDTLEERDATQDEISDYGLEGS